MYSAEEASRRLKDLANVFAYEAGVVQANVFGYAKVPKGVLALAEPQVDRLEQFALVLEAEGEGLSHEDLVGLVASAHRRLEEEAYFIDRQLRFKGFPASRRRFAEEQVRHLHLLGAGGDPIGYHHAWTRALKHLERRVELA